MKPKKQRQSKPKRLKLKPVAKPRGLEVLFDGKRVNLNLPKCGE